MPFFDPQPILRGSLVELRPLRPDDRDALYAVAADALIWEQHLKNRHEESAFQDFFTESLDSGGALLATDAVTQKVIGSSWLQRGAKRGRDRADVPRPVPLGRQKLMLRHAFRFVDSVIFLVNAENLRPPRVSPAYQYWFCFW